jgi:hypothetical protein
VLDDVVERRISDDDARHALRLDNNTELALSVHNRRKDASKRPDLLQEPTNQALDRLGIKLLDKPVQHDAATMAMVMEALRQQTETILKAQKS